MGKNLFLIRGNICAERVRLGRALQKPPMTQDDLARKIQLLGMEMTPLIISRIEKNQRHVCDAELRTLARPFLYLWIGCVGIQMRYKHRYSKRKMGVTLERCALVIKPQSLSAYENFRRLL